jgi:REP element-mobilizing transposase RayT
MANQPTPPNRRSVRIPEYDYAIEGSYFVTVCTHGKACTLGRLVHAHIEPSALGKLTRDCWQQIPNHFESVTLDEYIVMPNHLHGIIVKWSDAGTACRAPTDPRDPGVAFTPIVKEGRTQEKFGVPVVASLATIIRSFKSAVTKAARQRRLWQNKPLWQRGYYEHIIRQSESLEEIRQYIQRNPFRWAERYYSFS